MVDARIAILGAGPTGLGAAYRLKELGHTNFVVYEQKNHVGGLSASFHDGKGFTWDTGGHVLFSHYAYVDRLVGKLLKNRCCLHSRDAQIFVFDRFVPYPFQNNLHHLPRDKMVECVTGLLKDKKSRSPESFEDWILETFGGGISKYFMLPYNKKVWAYPLGKMAKNWISERVSVVDLGSVLKNIIYGRGDGAWGPNKNFKFPLRGGTGGLFNMFVPLIREHLHFNREAVRVDLKKKQICFKDGSTESYDYLISTIPLDRLVKIAEARNLYPQLKNLEHNSGYMVGIGVNRKNTEKKRCWIYFPEPSVPFYRVTYLSNYSQYNAPKNCFSLLAEISFSKHKKVSEKDAIPKTIEGLIKCGLLKKADKKRIISKYLIKIDHSYPIPTLGRDSALRKIQGYLMARGVHSRGRFGAWRYETGNMDHSIMQGKEAVDNILYGTRETVWTL